MTPAAATLIGTGALASLVGARLARAGLHVTLVGTWREALAAINARGVTVEDDTGRWSAPARAVGLGTELAPSALVLVLVKSHRTAAIAQAAAVSALPEGVIVTLQNGLGNRERLADAAGSERVAAGVAYLGATSLAPGEVRAGGGARVVIEAHPRAQGAVEALSVAGFVVERVADMAPAIWLKLATNCAINPLSALTGAVNGALPEDPERCATLRAAALEVGTVAARLGVRLEQDPAEAVVELARATAHNRSSMLADVARGAPTEIEALNGAVLRIAEQLGLDLPVNRRLVEAMRALPPAMCPC